MATTHAVTPAAVATIKPVLPARPLQRRNANPTPPAAPGVAASQRLRFAALDMRHTCSGESKRNGISPFPKLLHSLPPPSQTQTISTGHVNARQASKLKAVLRISSRSPLSVVTVPAACLLQPILPATSAMVPHEFFFVFAGRVGAWLPAPASRYTCRQLRQLCTDASEHDITVFACSWPMRNLPALGEPSDLCKHVLEISHGVLSSKHMTYPNKTSC